MIVLAECIQNVVIVQTFSVYYIFFLFFFFSFVFSFRDRRILRRGTAKCMRIERKRQIKRPFDILTNRYCAIYHAPVDGGREEVFPFASRPTPYYISVVVFCSRVYNIYIYIYTLFQGRRYIGQTLFKCLRSVNTIECNRQTVRGQTALDDDKYWSRNVFVSPKYNVLPVMYIVVGGS